MVQGVAVDVEGLCSISHRFDSKRCGTTGCCCHCYEVQLEPGELQRLIDWQPLAAMYQPALRQQAFPFEEAEPGEWVIESGETMRCPFSYLSDAGETLCSIHSAALEYGEDPFAIKPKSCSLWPLAMTEGEPPVLTLMEGVLAFPCNRRKRRPGLSPGVAELIGSVFGRKFLEEVKSLCT